MRASKKGVTTFTRAKKIDQEINNKERIKVKKKSKTQLTKDFETALIRTVAAFTLMQGIPNNKSKPTLSSPGFIINVMSGRVEEATEMMEKFYKEAGEWTDKNRKEEE